MRVGRFSHTGFNFLFQDYWKRIADFDLNFKEEDHPDLSLYAQKLIRDSVEKNLKNRNLDFSFWGIHIFFLPVSVERQRFFLNHLKETPPYHECYFSDDTPAYGLDNPYCSPISTLGELKLKGFEGAYIPSPVP